MRPGIEKLRGVVLRYVLGPAELQRLRLAPDDYVLIRCPATSTAESVQTIARLSPQLFPGHRIVVLADNVKVENMPREILHGLLGMTRPTPLDHRMEI